MVIYTKSDKSFIAQTNFKQTVITIVHNLYILCSCHSYLYRIPKFLYDAVSRYVILVRPVSEFEHKEVIIALDEGIFVPRDNLHNKCNGILQYKNIVQKRDHDFCNKKFGSYKYLSCKMII